MPVPIYTRSPDSSEELGSPLKGEPLRHSPGPKSALADALRGVNPRARALFGISDSVIIILEVIIILVRRLLDDADGRPLSERVAGIELELPAFDEARVELAFEFIDGLTERDLEKWLKRVATPQGRLFFRRLIGAAAYDKVERALREDGAVLVIGVRRAFRAVLPTAVALDDCTSVLSRKQIEECGGLSLVEHSALNLAFQLDKVLDQLLDMNLPLDGVPVRPDETRALAVDIDTLAAQLRVLVSSDSQGKIADLSDALARKMTGAQDALSHSVDGACQAANSLLEFIDRLLRQAFSESFVLEWLADNYPAGKDLTYENKDTGKPHPSKRGQALCFAHGGQPVEKESVFHLISAAGIIETRRRLQQIKHSDSGTSEELLAMEDLIRSVEGFFIFAIRVGWAGLSNKRLDDLRERF